MPPTFKVVVAICAVNGALSNRSSEGILICEGAISPTGIPTAGREFCRSDGRMSYGGGGGGRADGGQRTEVVTGNPILYRVVIH